MTASLLDSSQYSGLSQQQCSLDGIDSFSDLQLSNTLSNPLGTVPSAPTTIGIHCHPHFPKFLSPSGKVQIFVYLFTFFYSFFMVRWNGKIHYTAWSLFTIITP